MTHLTLYTTLGCHLCERLEALLNMLHAGEFRLEKIEISEDEALMERYGVRIPVLKDAAGHELDMGFEPSRLAAWLDERGVLDDSAWQRMQAGEIEQAREEEHQGKTTTRRLQGRRYLG